MRTRCWRFDFACWLTIAAEVDDDELDDREACGLTTAAEVDDDELDDREVDAGVAGREPLGALFAM